MSISEKNLFGLSILGGTVCAGATFLAIKAFERFNKPKVTYRPTVVDAYEGKSWSAMTPDQVEHELLKDIVAMPGLLFDQKDAATGILRKNGFGDDLLG